MGREIRRVPPDWEHPVYTKENARRPEDIGEFMSLYDNDFDSAAQEWIGEFDLWRAGKHPSQPCTYCEHYWEYSNPPDREFYRTRKWTEEEATHYQVYQTVSEGTPVTPHFATKEELIDYLVTKGDFWQQKDPAGYRGKAWDRVAAERFCRDEWAPSLIIHHTPTGTTIDGPETQRTL